MTTYTENDLRRVLVDPGFPDNALPQLFKNRGYRDALVGIAAREDQWDALADVARRSIAERGTQNGDVPFGEFTVLAMASWRSAGELYPTAEHLKELMLDGSEADIRMLKRLITVQQSGAPFRVWEAGMKDMGIEACIAFATREKQDGRA